MPRKSSVALEFSDTTARRISPPDGLAGLERELFLDIVCGCRADHFQPTDVPLVATFCESIVLALTAHAGLKADGYVTRGGKPSPRLAVLAHAKRAQSTY